MTDTKENILLVSLRLFARNGYEAVSVRDIAEQLGITKGALYKHYANKRDIFDCIVSRMNQLDYERARQYEVPEGTYAEMAEAYRMTPLEKIKVYSEAQFRHWTEDEFASSFRKMLTLEQYHDPEMAALFQQYLAGGPVGYMKDLFGEMTKDKAGITESPEQLALDFYGPIFLLIQMYDEAEDKDAVISLVREHIDVFSEKLK